MTYDVETGEPLLPDLRLYDPDRAWRVWMMLEATDWRYPHDLDDDAVLLHDVIEIAGASQLVERILDELKPKRKKNGSNSRFT